MKLHRSFIDTPFFMATDTKVIFETPLDPREDNEFRAQVVVETSDQLALPFTPLIDAASLNVTVTITYNREDIYTRSVSIARDDGPFWLQPAALLRDGPDILIRQVILPESCLAWNQRSEESPFEKYDDEFWEWLRFLALVCQQDEIAETLFSGGSWETCKARQTQAGYIRSGNNPVDDTAPFILRVSDHTTCEAEMCGQMDDLLCGAAHYAKQYGTDSFILREVAAKIPGTTKGHNGYRFVERSSTNRSRDYGIDRLLSLLGIDDDRWCYSDESEVCFACNGIIDCDYGGVRKDQATFVDGEGCLCACCCEGELRDVKDLSEDEVFEEFPDWLTQNIHDAQAVFDRPRPRTVPRFVLDHLLAAGFKKYGEDFENGMHAGQNDDPVKIAADIVAKYGASHVAFIVTEVGQFDVHFNVYHRVMGDFHPEANDTEEA